ncbi:MAG: beta-ketoacyl-[acyl-carrier-protein] synthase family protein [Kiritimatiellae bacterium]|nr:beta-ketoacyl-[acyl-carrier-protein] synthase family protein [Kiritimatiellia bacterium]
MPQVEPDGGAVLPITGMGQLSAAGGTVAEANACLEALHGDGMRATPYPVRGFFGKTATKPVFTVPSLREELPDARLFELLVPALDEALRDSGLSASGLSRLRTGVCLGTTSGCQFNVLTNRFEAIPAYRHYRETGTADRSSAQRYLDSNPAEWVRAKLHTTGPAVCVTDACSSGADAIGIAAEWLRNDVCDAVICGGVDALNPLPYAGFSSLGVYSDNPCKPFAPDRDGLNLGEGAGILVLETERSRRARGVTARGALLGYGMSADAYHLTAPDPSGEGLRRAIETAAKDAGVPLPSVTEINPHGTATLDNDAVESAVFASLLAGVPLFPTKAATGHTLGAAGAIEAVFSVLRGIRTNGSVLSTSLAFGGQNTALMLGAAGNAVSALNTPVVTRTRRIEIQDTFPTGRKARRADRFSRNTVLAAKSASGALPSGTSPERIGLLVATKHGPHASTFAFAEELVDAPGLPPSPLLFSHTVHNAAAAYAAMETGAKGPSCTLTAFHGVTEEAFRLARCWIASDRADAVIVVSVEERRTPLFSFVPDLEDVLDCFLVLRI